MKNGKFATALAAAALAWAMPGWAQESPVVGTWNIAAETPMGTQQSTWTFAEGSDGPTVTVVDAPMAGGPPGGAQGETPTDSTSDLVVDGAQFSFKRQLTTPMGPMEFAYTGSVAGTELTAEANTSFGVIAVTGTRAN